MLFKESKLSRFLKIVKIDHKLKNNSLSKDDKNIMKNYIKDSSDLNDSLINGHELNDKEKEIHNTILKHSKPLGQKVHLYSGTSKDFGKMARASKDGIIVSPAHISTTHSFNIAKRFAGMDNENYKENNKHMIHIHTKPTDKGFYVNNFAEHETILPAGTKLKYSHSTIHKFKNKNYKIHHFSIL
jgi:hypothetical protein